MNESQALDTAERALGYSGAEATVVTVAGRDGLSTRVADNVITQNVRCSRVTLSVECAFGQRHGSASTDDTSDSALRETVRRAEEIARVSPLDPEYMPPVAAAETAAYPAVKGFFESSASISPQEKAGRIARAASRVAAQGLRFSGGYPSTTRVFAVANSASLRAHYRRTDADIHATVLGPAGSGWHEVQSCDIAQIDVDAAVDEALRVATAAQNPQPLEPGRYDVILSPAAMAELLAFTLQIGFDAKATDENRTYLRGKMGQKMCGENITLRCDPADTRCPGAPFLDDGQCAPTLPFIQNGVLKNLVYSRYWAKKQNKTPVAMPTNILMDGGAATREQMIASTARGLLVTRFWYIRYVDPMIPLFTGMTRDGVFLIEDGKVTRPVQNLRFNENSIDVLCRVEMLGAPARTGEDMPLLFPPARIRQFNFTSGTKF